MYLSVKKRAAAVALAAIAMLAVTSTAGAAQADSTWRDHERALQAARVVNDTVIYRAQLAAVYEAVGATPRIAARFAALALGARDTAAASRWLGAVAAMGTPLDSAMLGEYAALAGPRATAALLSMRARATGNAGAPAPIFRLPDPNMISEDIAWDAPRSRLLVSSVRQGGVYARKVASDARGFTKFDADSSWGFFALGVDSARGVLWATTAALPMAAHYAASDSGRSALLKFDLATGRLRARYSVPDSEAHALGDLTIGPNGTVYVSDGLGSGVYALDAGSASLRMLVPQGVLESPQTPALSSDGGTLYVPDYSIGIAAVRVATGAVTWIAHSDSLALTGIDGLYRVGRDLIAVQNGLEPNRIMRLALDATMRRVVRATTVARGPRARELTHATFVGGWLYFLRGSGWDRVADDGTMTQASPSTGPEVVRVRLRP